MEKRRKVLTFTPVYDLNAKILLGYLGDLTLKGGLLVSEKPIEIDRTLTLAIEFHISSENPPEHVSLPARVAWCKADKHKTFYNTGLEFLTLTDQNKKVIETVLEMYKFSREMPTP
jgi:hypothetical protein